MKQEARKKALELTLFLFFLQQQWQNLLHFSAEWLILLLNGNALLKMFEYYETDGEKQEGDR